ncbi:WSC domain-containing protein [Lasiosphaeria ovina]|uniref:WSC domain-containing protein n=1 Tax=Lasiosphaeria ovina TaxID=92902 RepID=A0AAE0JVR1_9PEZI|nr:WSC domain-containing protein [Lasiosphaeria ovina]
MGWPNRTGRALVALAGLLGAVNAQGYFGTVQNEIASCGSDNFIYLGCYADFLNQAGTNFFRFNPQAYNSGDPSRSFPDWDPGSNYNNTMSPVGCARVCRGFGFKYAAVRDNNCNCGLQLPAALVPGLDTFCNVPCAGNSLLTCGGGNYAQVYVDPTFASPLYTPITTLNATLSNYYKYLGCYSISNGFPTQDTRAQQTFTSIDDCFSTCAALGYPLVFGSPQGFCTCGTSFGYPSYRVHPELLPTPGDCTNVCNTPSGAGGDCDPTTTRCCGTSNYYPVYINPELQGCYTPQIPGYKSTSTQVLYECDDIDSSYFGPPHSLPLGVYSLSQTINAVPALVHPLHVVGGARDYYIYGCYPQQALNQDGATGVFAPALSVQVPGFTPATLENCAAQCNTRNYDAFGMINGV